MKLSPDSELCRRYSIDELHGVDSLTAPAVPSFLLSFSSSRPRVSRNVNYTGSGTPIWPILMNKSRVSL